MLPLVICLTAGVAIWLIFRPGILSFDSVAQIDQAFSQSFNDANPPLMAVILSLVLRIGGGVTHVVLAQCLLGISGVFLLARVVCQLKIEDAVSRWHALAVTLVLLCPISPLAVYIATFWKDVWEMISMCWVAVFSLRLLSGRTDWVSLIGLHVAMLVSLLSRHNALVLLPAYGVLVAVIVSNPSSRWGQVAAFCLPTALFVLTDQTLRSGWNVARTDFIRCARVNEMIDMCATNPDIEKESPLMQAVLIPNYRANHITGFGGRNLIKFLDKGVSPAFWSPSGMQEFHREYWRALRNHPLAFLRTKWNEFVYHLRNYRSNPSGKFQNAVHPNDHGLAFKPETASIRTWLFDCLSLGFTHPVYQWFFTRHVVWLPICAAWVSLLLLRPIRIDVRLAAIPLLMLIALCYYLSYALVSIDGDFRYMYPSSLVVQVITLSTMARSLAMRSSCKI
jgi:hypothetical protein